MNDESEKRKEFIFTDQTKPFTPEDRINSKGEYKAKLEQYSHIGYLEFYVTNECNLTCSNCNRYNNYNFKGHFYAKDYKEGLKAWSGRIDASHKTIIGGEPTLHPELKDWVDTILEYWPDGETMMQSNGTVHRPEIESTPGLGLGYAIHDERMDLTKNRPKVLPEAYFNATVFTDCALVDKGEYFEVHDSDPNEAFANCSMKNSHTMLGDKLYKCPMPAILPEFIKQYDVRLTAEQKELLNSYKPLSSDCSDEELQEFIDNQEHPIPQCRLCPAARNEAKVSFDPKRKRRKQLIIGE